MAGKLGIIALQSAAHMGSRVDQILSGWHEGEHCLIPAECPVFPAERGNA